MEVEPILEKIENKQLRCFGHLIRADINRRAKSLWEARVDTKRSRGRPRKSWNNEIAAILEKRRKASFYIEKKKRKAKFTSPINMQTNLQEL